MRLRSKSKHRESHVHYHYHYYYPPEARARSHHENLSQSSVVQTQRARETESLVTPKAKDSAKMYTEGDQTMAGTSYKKMRMSDLCQVKKEFPSYHSASHQQFPNIKAKSVVEEEIQQYEDQPEQKMESDFSGHKSRVTEAETWSNHYKLLSFYEAEISNYKKQIDRLRMVEEECQYLRDTFLNHYTERCCK